jgi:hypothetical protein
MSKVYHVRIKLSKWRSPGRQKSMCFAAQGRLQGWAAKLLLVRWQSWHNFAIALQVNGPVVGLGAVRIRVGEFFASPGRRREVVPSR